MTGPKRLKTFAVFCRRIGATPILLPYRSTVARPSLFPITYPTLSPSTAPSHAKNNRLGNKISPFAASTEAMISKDSPGSGAPRDSNAKIAVLTYQRLNITDQLSDVQQHLRRKVKRYMRKRFRLASAASALDTLRRAARSRRSGRVPDKSTLLVRTTMKVNAQNAHMPCRPNRAGD